MKYIANDQNEIKTRLNAIEREPAESAKYYRRILVSCIITAGNWCNSRCANSANIVGGENMGIEKILFNSRSNYSTSNIHYTIYKVRLV